MSLFPVQLRTGVVLLDRVLSMDEMDLFKNYYSSMEPRLKRPKYERTMNKFP